MATLHQTYPDEILDRLHESMLEILDAIAEVCEKNDISWYLAAGTALGALRHGGFIPWDDDIDVGMMREDYDRFLEIAPQALPERFEILIPGVTPGYAPLFAKVCIKGTRFWTDETMEAGLDMGIFVDIWPRDYVAADPVLRRKQEQQSNLLRSMMYLYYSQNVHARLKGISAKGFPKLFPIAHKVLPVVTSDDAIRRKFAELQIAPGAKSGGTTCFPSSGFRVLPESLFEHFDTIEFAGRRYPVPTPCEEYCRLVYGEDWNQLPPMEKRVNHAPLVLDFGDGVNVFA